MDSNQHADTRRERDMTDEVVERFRPTSGRAVGIIALVAALVVAAVGVVEHDQGFPVPFVLGAVLVAVLAWAALLRPRVWVTSEDLVLHNMLHTARVPLAAIESVVVRQVLAVTAGERRFVSPAIGRSHRQTVHMTRRGTRPGPLDSYPTFVEDRITQLADDARARAGVAKRSAEQRALAGGVRRDWAWPEVVALGAAVLALVFSLLV